jgi:hypothetical protein
MKNRTRNTDARRNEFRDFMDASAYGGWFFSSLHASVSLKADHLQ